MSRFTRPVKRRRDGTYDLRLGDDERDLLRSLVPQLRELLVSGEDPSLARLFPNAYPDDPEREREYRAMVHDELLEQRLAALDVIEETASATRLDEDQLTAWLQAINSIRLVLGTRLDVSEDMDMPAPGHPDAPAFAVYHYLSWLLDGIVGALGG